MYLSKRLLTRPIFCQRQLRCRLVNMRLLSVKRILCCNTTMLKSDWLVSNQVATKQTIVYAIVNKRYTKQTIVYAIAKKKIHKTNYRLCDSKKTKHKTNYRLCDSKKKEHKTNYRLCDSKKRNTKQTIVYAMVKNKKQNKLSLMRW